MNKIPTVFERDWDGDRSRVLDIPAAGCEWVFAGEGVATRKLDGTCCMVREGDLYKRHEVRPGKAWPPGFEAVENDGRTGKVIGWVPVHDDRPEDRWHREGLANRLLTALDGTYELLGPKVQGNPEGLSEHQLVAHTDAPPYIVPRTFVGMRDLLRELADNGQGVEGFVFHHDDGRMAKIKSKDFGIRRVPS